jgi:hypothetical protein
MGEFVAKDFALVFGEFKKARAKLHLLLFVYPSSYCGPQLTISFDSHLLQQVRNSP